MKPLDLRREEAEERLRAWRSLSPEEQLAELDARLGPGQGARRQRERIQRQIAENRAAKSQAAANPENPCPR